jgi:putative hydrolase of the HAD superfamily
VTVTAVLVDADGVLQSNPAGWDDAVRSFVAPADGDDFTDDLWEAERAALRGECTFADVVSAVAERWGFVGREDELTALWRTVEVDRASTDLVRQLRAQGLACHLVTNQNDVRASYLRDELGYGDLFDRCFCSCEVGATKDDPAFFAHVLDELRLPAEQLLLVDDQPRYAEVARSLGLRTITWELTDGIGELRRRLAAEGVGAPR